MVPTTGRRPARRLKIAVALLAAGLLPALVSAADASAERAWQALSDGAVVLFRHANAPGVGDPPGISLADCATQRNLDEAGREQARRIGRRFAERGVRVGAVLTSQWCRARETATLAFGKAQVREEPAFNSFFGAPDRRSPQTERARAIIAGWRGPGVLVVTTHQVNITALTGVGTASAEGMVVRPPSLEVVGTVPAD